MDDTGTMITEEKQIIHNFKEHFLNDSGFFLGQNSNLNTDYYKVKIGIEMPKNEEIENIIKRHENNKAPEENSIVAELLKIGDTVLVNKISEVIKTIWETETIPEDWKIAIVCPILKKGNPTKTENYRGISLLDTGYKMFTSLI